MTRICGVAAVLFPVCFVVADARQGASGPPPKPVVPAAANSIAANPAAFYGQNVTVTAAVDQILSPTSFTIDQDLKKRGAGAVVVLSSPLSGPLNLDAYVTVIGQVVSHEGRPAIRATAVINAAMVDLAQRIRGSMTPDEEAFDTVMKRIGPAFSAVREAVTDADAGNASENVALLIKAFAETQSFWKKRAIADAQTWSSEARTYAESLDRAVTAAKWDDAKAALTSLQQTCSACHEKFRERQHDGSYRIRQ